MFSVFLNTSGYVSELLRMVAGGSLRSSLTLFLSSPNKGVVGHMHGGSLISASSAAPFSASSTLRVWLSGTSATCGPLEHWSGEGAGAGSSGFWGGSHGNTVHSNYEERHRQNFAFLKFIGFFLRADALKEGSMGRSSGAGR